jgi:hypothetical protein
VPIKLGETVEELAKEPVPDAGEELRVGEEFEGLIIHTRFVG